MAKRSRENHNQRKRRRDRNVQVKIGHGGTLDPLATGVLIAGVGKGTKALQGFLECTKVYETIVLFGTSTDTYDRVGKVLRRAPYEHITKEKLEEALNQFRGKFMQLPPLFSALKMNGKPLYEYAREGKEIPREIERRHVEVLNLELVEWMEGGTHSHEAPTDEAGYAEVNVANKFWTKENVLPASSKEAVAVKNEEEEAPATSESTAAEKIEVRDEPKNDDQQAAEARNTFEQKKRKMSEDQDDLVQERPTSKKGKAVPESEEAIMSGGLATSTPPPTLASREVEKPEVLAALKVAKGPPAAKLRMTVTSGFYVRSLCHDLGAALGSAALMAELERTRQGEFELGKNCLKWEDLSKGEMVWGPKVEGWLDDWVERTERKPLASDSQSAGESSNAVEESANAMVKEENKEALAV